MIGFLQSLVISVLARLIVPPQLSSVDWGSLMRNPNLIKATVEKACLLFFWAGISQGFWIGFVAGGFTLMVYLSIRSVCRALVRLINVHLHRLHSTEEPLP